MTEKLPEEFLAMMAALHRPSDKPSLDRSSSWHMAIAPGESFYSDDNSGKWCVFVPQAEVDAAWLKVKAAIQEGHLLCGKVSTAYARGNRPTHVMCIYTRDWSDEADLAATRATLRDLGFTEELGYKRDLETQNGVYGEGEWYRRS